MRLTVVGCSGSFPGPESAASCYLVEADDDTGRTWRILLDLGSGALGPLQRHIDIHDLDAILLSHLHPDHCLDLCGLYVALRYHPNGPPEGRIPVYGPNRTSERLAAAYGVEEGSQLATVYAFRTWTEAEPVEIGPWSVTPMQVDHPIEAYGLRIEQRTAQRDAVLTYSGDTDACFGLTRLAKDADVLLAEAAFMEHRDRARHIHLTGYRAGQTATEASARRLLLTHLPVWNDPAAVLAEARSTYGGPVDVVRPGASYEI